jgi:hypothetical protein
MAYADICLGLHHLLRDLQVGVLKNFSENQKNLSSVCHQIGAPKALCHASPLQDGFATANLGYRPRNWIARVTTPKAFGGVNRRVMMELMPEVNRAFSAGAFFISQSWGVAPG